MEFKAVIKETLQKTVTINDDSITTEQEALEYLGKKINNCEIVLDADDFVDRTISILK